MIEQERVTITAITPQKRRPTRVSVYFDGEFALGADALAIHQRGWRVGTEVGPEELLRAREELEYQAARLSAEAYLGYRSRTEQEVVRRLKEKGYSPAAVEHALAYLKSQGFINDEQYAAQAAGSATSRRWGRSRVAADLRRRGVDRDLAAEAVSQIAEEDEVRGAREFAERRAATMSHLDPMVRKRRLTAALQRRGFSYSAIRSAMDGLWPD